jgi:two-component system, CAI-1 autoinducer sensor kinase/phosphatase CqsS
VQDVKKWSDDACAWLSQRSWFQWLRAELVVAPLEPVSYPSPQRLWWVGLSILLGNALFAWTWQVWLPQPYENLTLRLIASLLGCSLMAPQVSKYLGDALAQSLFGLVLWLELPLFFSWMYLCNSGSTVWLATMAAMLLIYYHLTDWRLATLGSITGALLAWGLFQFLGPAVAPIPESQHAIHAMVLAFAWLIALELSLLLAHLRRTQLAHSLATMSIMAHELRSPLAAVALIGDALLLEVERQPDNARSPQFEKLASRLQGLARNMNRQMDTQIANAKLLQLPSRSEDVCAADLVHQVVAAYPFATSRQRGCVQVLIHRDFTFLSSFTQFSQVLDNLIKNALYSLMAADSKYPPGALRIEAGTLKQLGRIVVSDEGMGIDAALLPHIFKPFFSSNHGTGHGLGLAFCQQVVRSAGGSISVKSQFAIGATFTIELPLAADAIARTACHR